VGGTSDYPERVPTTTTLFFLEADPLVAKKDTSAIERAQPAFFKEDQLLPPQKKKEALSRYLRLYWGTKKSFYLETTTCQSLGRIDLLRGNKNGGTIQPHKKGRATTIQRERRREERGLALVSRTGSIPEYKVAVQSPQSY